MVVQEEECSTDPIAFFFERGPSDLSIVGVKSAEKKIPLLMGSGDMGKGKVSDILHYLC